MALVATRVALKAEFPSYSYRERHAVNVRFRCALRHPPQNTKIPLGCPSQNLCGVWNTHEHRLRFVSARAQTLRSRSRRGLFSFSYTHRA